MSDETQGPPTIIEAPPPAPPPTRVMESRVEKTIIPADVISRRTDLAAKYAADPKPDEAKSEPEKKPDEPEKPNESEALEALQRLLADDPEALEFVKQLAKDKGVVRSFISLKRQRGQLAKKERVIERREQQLAENQRELQALRELQQKDPLGFARRLGLTFRQLAQAAEKDGETPDPKEVERREMLEKLGTVEQRQKQIEEREAELQAQTEVQQLTGQVESWIAQREDQYPHVFAEYEPREIARQAAELARKKYRETGEALDLPTEFGKLERVLAQREQQRQQRLSAKRRVEPPKGSSAERGNGAVQTARPGDSKSPDSLSTADASQKTVTRPQSREERLEAALRHFNN